MTDHKNRVAVITGAGGGLGRALALLAAANGARVALSDVSADNVSETADLVRAAGGTAEWQVVDVRSEEDVTEWRLAINDSLGPVSILHNVAGIVERSMLDATSLDAFRRVVDVNLVGAYNCIKTFSTDMLEHNWGRIVNVASIAGVTGYPFPSYGASKGGVIALTRSVLHDFFGTGITSNVVCPGAMDTPMMSRSAVEKMAAQIPTGRVSPPEDIAAAMDFLSSDAAASINGATLVVDGGATAQFAFTGARGEQ